MKYIAVTILSLSLLPLVWPQSKDGAQPQSSSNGHLLEISRAGSRPSAKGPPQNFTGFVRVEQLFSAEPPSRVSGGSVTFAPGARTAWHTHPFGQILIVTAGVGRVQIEGGPVQEIRAGDLVRIPPNRRHWHGAAPDSSMTHIAIQEGDLTGKAVDWMAGERTAISGSAVVTESAATSCRRRASIWKGFSK